MGILVAILEWIGLLALLAWWTWYCLVPVGDSVQRYAIRWVATFVIVGLGAFVASFGPIASLSGGVFLLVMLAAAWKEPITELMGGWIGGMFDGGSQRVDNKPLLNQAEALRRQGSHREAIRATRDALTERPDDFDGLMLIATIQSEDLKELERALGTVEDALRNKRIEPGQIVYALNTLADWHLKAIDPDAARACLRRIMDLLPNTDAAQRADQRIMRIKEKREMLADAQPKKLVMPEFERDLGLKGKKSKVKRKGSDPAEIIAELENQLARHPNDWTAREELARVYAEDRKDIPRAVEELERLVSGSRAPKQEVARWLHQMSDWQSRVSRDTEAARATLQRIVELFPDSALAHRAETAKAYLRTQS